MPERKEFSPFPDVAIPGENIYFAVSNFRDKLAAQLEQRRQFIDEHLSSIAAVSIPLINTGSRLIQEDKNPQEINPVHKQPPPHQE